MYTKHVYNSFSDIEQEKYERFFYMSSAPVFYNPKFLLAAEESPLLPVLATYYIVIYQQDDIVAFIPVYLQTDVDPFNVLNNASSFVINKNSKVLLTHIMHCSDSTYLMDMESDLLFEEMNNSLNDLAKQIDAEYYGVINIQNKKLLEKIDAYGYKKYFMWNKYCLDVSNIETIDYLYALISRNGRKQYKKNLRKFENSPNAFIKIERAIDLSEDQLSQIATLCHKTSQKYGTGYYYPIKRLTKFMSMSAEIITLISVYADGKRISSNICFVYGDTLYMWACGMTYDNTDFSPYIMTILKAFEYAKLQNLRCIDIGRTSRAMKERMGFSAKPLFFILNKVV